MKLTDEEVQTLQDLWSNRDTVNWAVYDRLKDKILRGARPKAAPHEGAAVADGGRRFTALSSTRRIQPTWLASPNE
jgi:hypothetical protein